MAIEGVNVNLPSAEAIVSSQRALESQKDVNKDDAADIARKRLAKKVAIKKEQLKSSDAHKEVFSRQQQNDQKMQQILGGAAGPDAADALGRWGENQNLQEKLTEAQKQMFKEAMAKNPPKATKSGRALDNLAKDPSFSKAIKSSQQMGTLQKALIDDPGAEKPAGELLKNRFMQSKKADQKGKNRFLEFGLAQAKSGKLGVAKKAGDMLGSLADKGVGKSAQRASVNMVQRTGGDPKAAGNVDNFVSDPNVSKMPNFARSKATELLAKTDGKKDAGESFKKLAGDGVFKSQTAQNKGRFFSTIGTGRPSEFRQLSDSLLTSLQTPGFPKRAGQVKKFLGEVSKQVQSAGASGVDGQAAMKKSKMSPMPQLQLLRMDPESMSEEELGQARSQNRANVMQFYNKLNRMYDDGEKKLRSAKYLEDVNKLQTIRMPEDIETSGLTAEEAAFVQDRQAVAKERYNQLAKMQKQRSRELRTKRRRRGKAGLRRTHGRQPRYFTPGLTRGSTPSRSFLALTGTGGPRGLAPTPQRDQRAAGAAVGGDVQASVASALSTYGGQITAHNAGQVARAIAEQVASEVTAQLTQQLLGSSAPMAEAPVTKPPPKAAPALQTDGWGIPRNFEPDLGGTQRAAVKPSVDDGGQTFAEAISEKYTGKVLVKDPTSIRDIGSLFEATWKGLNKPEMALLKNLGWNQQTWDTKDTAAAKWPGAMMTAFVGLTPVQREAVRKLGFTPHDWDTKVQAMASGKNA